MADDWLARLKGHADLVQRLVKEIPKALEKPGLTLEQASRLHAVIQKGARDFDQLVGVMNGLELDESYRRAATSLAKIWSHLSNAAADRVQEAGDAEYDDGVSGEPIDSQARSDRDDV
ncbi:MAG TPA: hypothetical protein VK638_54200 [Edaphobacter sp.]|jgi:hypothetical protein|nr:hypothetical protein [Edaphobacter sp.]